MAFRNDLDAAHARTRALEQRVAELEAENTELEAENAELNAPVSAEANDKLVRTAKPALAMEPSREHMLATTWPAVGTFSGMLALASMGGAMLLSGLPVLGIALLTVAALGICVSAVAWRALEGPPPGFVLVLSGRNHERPDGSTRGYRVLTEGRTMRTPILESAEYLDCRARTIRLTVKGAYSKGGEPLSIEMTGLRKINEREPFVGHAIERFLGSSATDVDRVARETLEGHMRGVIAELTAEEIRENPEALVAEIAETVHSDLDKLGLELAELAVVSVSDKPAD